MLALYVMNHTQTVQEGPGVVQRICQKRTTNSAVILGHLRLNSHPLTISGSLGLHKSLENPVSFLPAVVQKVTCKRGE